MNIHAPAFSLCVLITMTSHAMKHDSNSGSYQPPKIQELRSMQLSDHSSAKTDQIDPMACPQALNPGDDLGIPLSNAIHRAEQSYPVHPGDRMIFQCLRVLFSCFGPPEPFE